MSIHNRPFVVDVSEYPFADHWFERDGAALHYVDEGAGLPVVLLHGNPTWSYLYRNVIKQLNGACRTIAPDYPGFGFSDHPPQFNYRPPTHAEWIRAFLDHLNLERFVLVIQDWGGPIGLSLAVEQPERVAGLVIANTWCWPLGGDVRLIAGLFGSPVGKYFILQHNFFARQMIPLGLVASRHNAAVLQAYRAPFPTVESRRGTYVFPWALTHSDEWLTNIEAKLSRLSDKPVELVWGMQDPLLGRAAVIRRWQSHFPAARVERVAAASHFIQEDYPGLIADAVRRVLAQAE
jgi:haloalkane dehalogenase